MASLLRPPATPISAKNEQNSNFSVKHHQDKTCSWHCPFCSFKTIESNSTRRSHEIRDHLGRCHPFEFKKAQQESSESQASNQLRHGLGIMKQVKPLEFVKIKKEDAGFSCPYCRLGTVHMPSNSTLRRKTLKHHLKQCKKAPKDCSIRQLRTDIMKKDKKVSLVADDQKQKQKMKEGIQRKAHARACKLGHTPIHISFLKQKKCQTIQFCTTCLQAASHSRKWGTPCKGHADLQLRIPPSLQWWKHHFKLIGKDKLRNEIGLSFSQLKMIEASLEKFEIDRKKRITDKKRRLIKGIFTKKECKARRLAGLRKRSVDIAINYGHSPLRLHAQKIWQPTACTNLVCGKCWKSSTNKLYLEAAMFWISFDW